MHLQAVIPFAQEKGKFFALTTISFTFNSAMPTHHKTAMDLETMLFLCTSM
jgi:hypothetical protein